ncbi:MULTISPECIES: hypothetical protein [Streptomyces]|uniref:hypothetical protein n=1 Tax=Streptomyces TaxID=1883 RepID=UPI000F656E9F|nr:hypothetical protein [Streptomyces alboflavus]
MAEQQTPHGPEQIVEAKLEESQIRVVGQTGEVSPQDLSGNGYTYRHDWGAWNGFVRFNLTSSTFTANTRVFVAVSEPTGGGGKFIGAARYLVYNVAPDNGVVSVRVHIDWGSPLGVPIDYFIVNP